MAFAGVEETRELYRLAIAERYRFYSFGDAMLVLWAHAADSRSGAVRRTRVRIPLGSRGWWAGVPRGGGGVTVFEVTATDGAARAGILRTAHGDVPTPAFMPVGTKATRQGARTPTRCATLGATILLGNTYHLHFRPGEELIAELGGLHAFMGWDGPILTDSGGFQVFSLRDTIAAVDDDGVTFRSVYDGDAARFTPELVAAHPGAARLRHRDVPRRLPACRRRRATSSTRRSG